MGCSRVLSHEEVRAALSARVDGEDTGLDDDVVDAHVSHCASCRAYYDRVLSLSHNLRFVEADGGMAPPEDLSQLILDGVDDEWRRISRRRTVWLALGRVALVVLALVWGVWAVDGLVQSPAQSLGAVEQAAGKLGVASALLLSAARPGQIPGVALVVGTMFTFSLGFAILDGELAGHLLVLLPTLVALVGMLAVDRWHRVSHVWRMLGADPRG